MTREYTCRNLKNLNSGELADAIREKLSRITSGRHDSAVMLKNIMISLPEKKKYGWTNYFFLHSIYIGNDGRIYGDLISVTRGESRELLFEKDLENLGRDELLDVFTALEKNRWSQGEEWREAGAGASGNAGLLRGGEQASLRHSAGKI